jgi:glycosyltransferase involved in cell wall biosynthesis
MESVSVILPTYNRANLLPRAVRSVLNQTYKDFELIIIDDGSTDNTVDIVKSFDDPRISYIKLEKNKGAPAALNIGIDRARGQFIAFQDSDDEWHREKLSRQVAAFKDAANEVGVVYSGMWRISDDKRTFVPGDDISKKEGDIHESLLSANFIGPPAAMVKKECFSKVGVFDESLPCIEDWELWLRLSKCYHFIYLPEPMVNAYYSPDSTSIDYEKLPVAFELLLTKHFEEFKGHKRLLARYYMCIANCLCSYGDISKGRRYLAKALKEYPLNIKSLLCIFLSFLGQNVYRCVFLKFDRK